MKHIEIATIGQLIEYLEIFGKSRPIIVDYDGNTRPVTTDDIGLWCDDYDAPVAIFMPNE